jgi:ADP-ribosylglycohydrolase
LQHSLLSHFHGCIIGSLLAENQLKSQQSFKNDIADLTACWLNGAIATEDWKQIYSSSLNKKKRKLNSGEAIAAVLPAFLLFHDDFRTLTQQLEEFASLWEIDRETVEEMLIWGYAIALAFREKLNGERAIEQLLASKLKIPIFLKEQLEQAEICLANGLSLKQSVARIARSDTLARSTIAIALYCFASTPEDFHLALMRAVKVAKQAPAIANLTGAIAGAYNSFSGIPLRWRVLTAALPKSKALQQSTNQTIIDRTTELFAVWSGAYRLNNLASLQTSAIASASVIQPRSNLKIISQQDYLSSNVTSGVDSQRINQ